MLLGLKGEDFGAGLLNFFKISVKKSYPAFPAVKDFFQASRWPAMPIIVFLPFNLYEFSSFLPCAEVIARCGLVPVILTFKNLIFTNYGLV